MAWLITQTLKSLHIFPPLTSPTNCQVLTMLLSMRHRQLTCLRTQRMKEAFQNLKMNWGAVQKAMRIRTRMEVSKKVQALMIMGRMVRMVRMVLMVLMMEIEECLFQLLLRKLLQLHLLLLLRLKLQLLLLLLRLKLVQIQLILLQVALLETQLATMHPL